MSNKRASPVSVSVAFTKKCRQCPPAGVRAHHSVFITGP
jgi:hypothetical protein